MSVPPAAGQRGEPFVPAAPALAGLLLLLPVQASAAPANTHQVPDRLRTGVHRQRCAQESRGRHGLLSLTLRGMNDDIKEDKSEI